MIVGYAPAMLAWIAGAAFSQVTSFRAAPSAPAVVPSAIAPLMSAPSLEFSPLTPAALSVRVLGVPAPDVTPAHIEAAKALVAATGLAHAVAPGGAATPIPAKLELWDGRAPHASIEEAVGRGNLVVAPAPPQRPGVLGVLQKHARPWRTDEQLAKLAAKPAGSTVKFAVIGDAEPGRFWISRKLFNEPGVFWRLLSRANVSSPDFILQLGDMVSRGTVLNFWSFLRELVASGLRAPYLTVLGNHDRFKPHGVTNSVVYQATFGSPNYVFERGGWRFVVVDSSAGRITKPQLDWLSSVLDGKTPTVVFTHIPPAPLSEWTDWGRFKGAGGFKEGAVEFMMLMSARKVSRVYMGHIHGLGVLERGGVKYVLTGGGGSPLFPGPVKRKLHHWLSIEAGPDGLSETVHEADGASYPLH
ncbi:MAG: metallophosphoesterase [Elusimicrobia bacterium]|nr:metallophosphoesterase [Elusimicrobiota bacterium]